MESNLTICNNCAGKIVRSLLRHYTHNGLDYCSERCAEAFCSPENIDSTPIGLVYDLEGN